MQNYRSEKNGEGLLYLMYATYRRTVAVDWHSNDQKH